MFGVVIQNLCEITVLRALVWQDASGDVYLAWNDPVHLVTTRDETKGCEGITTHIARAMAGFAKQATQ